MKFSSFALGCALVATLAIVPGCATGGPQEGPSGTASSSVPASSSADVEVASNVLVSPAAAMPSSMSSDEADSSENEEASLAITVNGTTMRATFEDNSSAAAFVEMLTEGSVTVSAQDYGGFEKVGPLPQSLPTNDVQITAQPGDVILYQGNQITVYYDQNTWSFTRLARIDGATRESMLDVLGDGDVDITFSLGE